MKKNLVKTVNLVLILSMCMPYQAYATESTYEYESEETVDIAEDTYDLIETSEEEDFDDIDILPDTEEASETLSIETEFQTEIQTEDLDLETEYASEETDAYDYDIAVSQESAEEDDLSVIEEAIAIKLTGVLTAEDGKIYGFIDGEQCFGLKKMPLSNGTKAWYYFQSDGSAYTDGLKTVGSDTYFFNKDGKAFTGGLKTVGSNKYYFTSQAKAAKNILLTVTESGAKSYYYFGSDGKAYKSGFKKVSSYGTAEDNHSITKSSSSAVNFYWFTPNGTAFTGGVLSFTHNSKKCVALFQSNGKAFKGLKKTADWHTVGSDGYPVKRSNSTAYTYYFLPSGVAYNGGVLKTKGGKTYHFQANSGRAYTSGYRKTSKIAYEKTDGTVKDTSDGNYYYYLSQSDGTVYTAGLKSFKVNDKTQYAFFSSNGKALQKKWKKSGSTLYYFGKNGLAVSGKQTINGHQCYFNSKCAYLYAQKDNCKLFHQGDYGEVYGVGLKNAGCGPTSAAMLVSAYNAKVTPETIAKKMYDNGWWSSAGTSTYMVDEVLEPYGFKCIWHKEDMLTGNYHKSTFKLFRDKIDSGKVDAYIIMNVQGASRGDAATDYWTGSDGHIMIITNYRILEDGSFEYYVRDPGRKKHTGWYKDSKLLHYVNTFAVYTHSKK